MEPLSIQTLAFRADTPDDLAELLGNRFGLYVRLSDAWPLLGYRSVGAARRAAYENRLVIQSTTIAGRRGHLIKSKDLAQWLFNASRSSTSPTSS